MVSLARYLPIHGWSVTVLTVRPAAYNRTNTSNLELIPEGTDVIRSVALDTKRHLAIAGRHLEFMAVPDRWRTWKLTGTAAGMKLTKRNRPDVILSSFPIPTAIEIAGAIHRRSNIPWVADLRDPIVVDNHPAQGTLRDAYCELERLVFESAKRVVVTTSGAAELYRQRYPATGTDRIRVIENGYDEDMFKSVDQPGRATRSGEQLTLLHSGLVYEEARNPVPLFEAVANAIESGAVTKERIRIVFRASNRAEFILSRAARFGLSDVVRAEPPITYKAAVEEMLRSDSLLIIQSAECNQQIPAKAYEYLRARRPILALTDPNGETGKLLAANQVEDIAALEDEAAVNRVVENHLTRLQSGSAAPAGLESVKRLSREARAAEFAKVLDEAIG